MGLESLLSDIESVDGVALASEEQSSDWKGTVLHISLDESAEGDGESVLDDVLDVIPRDFLSPDYDPDERLQVYYDAVEIRL